MLWVNATHCNTLQHTATHINVALRRVWVSKGSTLTTLQQAHTQCESLQHTATHCNTLQHTATWHSRESEWAKARNIPPCSIHTHSMSHCNTLQHTATRNDVALKRVRVSKGSKHNTLQHTHTPRESLQHTAPHCTTLTHSNTLHHACTLCEQKRPWYINTEPQGSCANM